MRSCLVGHSSSIQTVWLGGEEWGHVCVCRHITADYSDSGG